MQVHNEFIAIQYFVCKASFAFSPKNLSSARKIRDKTDLNIQTNIKFVFIHLVYDDIITFPFNIGFFGAFSFWHEIDERISSKSHGRPIAIYFIGNEFQ